jgi:hypothetical protein
VTLHIKNRKFADKVISGDHVIPEKKMTRDDLLIVDDDMKLIPPKYMLYSSPTVRLTVVAVYPL